MVMTVVVLTRDARLGLAANERGTHYKRTGVALTDPGREGGREGKKGPDYILAASSIFLTSIVL